MKKLMLIMIPFACFAGEVRYPKAATYFVAYDSNGLRHIGITETNQVTVSGQPEFYASAFDAEFLSAAKTIGISNDWNPLPAMSNMVAKGIYSYEGGLVICRQEHIRTEHAPGDVPALFSVYRGDADGLVWIANEPVKVGDTRAYNGTTYTAIQSHTTQSDWIPPNVPALWQEVVPPSVDWRVGEAVKVGDIRVYNSKTYQCLQAHTTQAGWTPPVVPALWKQVE